MIRRGVLACYLAQFPSSFRLTKQNLDYVARLAGNLDAPVCTEFRTRTWEDGEVYEFLRDNEIGYVNVDLPTFKMLPWARVALASLVRSSQFLSSIVKSSLG